MKKTLLIPLVSAALTPALNAAIVATGSVQSTVNAPNNGGSSAGAGIIASEDEIKVFGTLELTTTTAGESVGNILTVNGDVTLAPGEAFGINYEFSANIVGGGDVSLTIMGTTNFGGIEETIKRTETFSGAGDYDFNFALFGAAAETEQVGTWNGQVTFDWTNVPANSALTITIPNDSIDFVVQTVPEPSAALLGLLGAAACFTRRRS